MYPLLEQWLNSLTLKNYSTHTVNAYRRDILNFLNFCQQQNIDFNLLHRSDIQDYLVHQIEYQHLQNKSLQRHLSAIRQFMQWINEHQHYPTLATQDIKIKQQNKTLPGVMSEKLITQLLEQPAPTDTKQQALWIRDKAILELFYSSGLRLSELQRLTFKDIDFERKLLNIMGKGNKNRILPFGSKAYESLLLWFNIYRQWLNISDFSPNDALFITQKGDPISIRQIENRVKYQAQRAGIAINLHPHLLRHSFASHMLNRSGDLRAVQDLLGHEQASTTAIYTHLNFNELKEKYKEYHPLARRQKD